MRGEGYLPRIQLHVIKGMQRTQTTKGKNMTKKLLIMLASMVLLMLFTPLGVKAEDEINPRIGVREPYMVYDEAGNASVYTGDDQAARSSGLEHWEGSKKGIQVNEYLSDPNYKDLGIKHVLLNMVLSDDCISYENGQYHLKDSSYVNLYRTSLIPFLNQQGISVTMVLLMDWSSDPNLQQLIYAGGRQPGMMFYELNTQDDRGRNAWTNIFNELVQQFNTDTARIDHYILGNEVNQYGKNGYNYTGSKDLATNVSAYADAFVILERAVRTYSPSARTYISLDHNWTASDSGHSGKSFLDSFAGAVSQRDEAARWNVSWHAYAPSLRSDVNVSMDKLVIWNSSLVTRSESTPYICGSNIEVLTNYIKKHWGSDHMVHLSEQGYDASGSVEWQAAFVAYTYYAAQYNDMVVAVTYRAYVDNRDEQGLKFGLVGAYMDELESAPNKAAFIESRKRPAYDVFKYMDTNQALQYTNRCLATIGAANWNELIPGGHGPTQEGWNSGPKGERYYVQNGQVLKGWQTIEGQTYYLQESNGVAVTGTPLIEGKKYWFDGNGQKQTGWMNLLNMILYFDPEDNGAAVLGYRQFPDGKEYVFDQNGVVVTEYGTPIINGQKYWIVGDGTLRTGWMVLGDWKLYFDPEKKYALTGIQQVEDKTYLFDDNGVLVAQAGTPVVNGKKYWFKEDGSLGSGWMYLTNWIMYFRPDNYEASVGLSSIDGKKYLFDPNGVCYIRSRTDVINGKKYWFQPDGSLATGWLKLGAWTMYFWPDECYAATGQQSIDGQTYYFDGNGVLQR